MKQLTKSQTTIKLTTWIYIDYIYIDYELKNKYMEFN